ncbi:tyrosyl-tRNA synthetase [Spiroplasma tabanidicola]|uniref:Tyrosine--tRNA ligase n=2 Tax=Spiroplasma tabanidicola TaxID=324079 RepID=A0A6I6CDB7_9MOLU|nr:tyrosine--tRNA ligase [Spiroplasma tabanidicola]QGS52308.1 tyrosyl-tRNA synthetase [Spiroplasma tabanidicola]
MKSIIEELKQRDLLNQITNEEKLLNAQKDNAGVYCGFDPTADSLHIGHIIPLINLKRFQDFGFKPILILGGATGMIGDPSFKNTERVLLTLDKVKENVESIRKQVTKIIPSIEVVDNNEWLGKMSLIDFLRIIGKDFNLAYLLAKENIATRIEKGLSVTEFSYTMLQGYDFYQLYSTRDCRIQFGGSDQWGNITSGTDYIASKVGRENSKAAGVTFKLLTKKDGGKFGKSETGTIWLDANKTSEYELYQFFVNQDDDDVETFLKHLTTLELEEIDKILTEHKKEPFKRLAQKRLGQEVVSWVHGQEGYQKAIKITEAIFSGDIESLNESELKAICLSIPNSSSQLDLKFIDFLVSSKIASSNREARELIRDKSITIKGRNDFKEDEIIGKNFIYFGKTIIVKKGKKKYFSVKCS